MKNNIISVCLQIIVFFLSITSAQQSHAATLKVLNVESSGTKIILEGSLKSATSESIEYQIKDSVGNLQSLKTKPRAQNLWILIDSSALCETYKMDSYVSSVIAQLPKLLNDESLVSIISFTQDGKNILATNTPPNALGELKVECQPGTLSASFDEPLEQLLASSVKNNLPTHVWAYSSGNISLSPQTKQHILDKNIGLNLSLYVPLVFQDLQPLFASTSKALGDNFFYSILKQDIKSDSKTNIIIPERLFSGEFYPSINAQGATKSFKIEAIKSGKEGSLITSTQFHALVRKGWFLALLESVIFRTILLLTGLYMLFCMIRKYIPKKCLKCHRTLKFKEDCCLFCNDNQNPSLLIHEKVKDKYETKSMAVINSNFTLYEGRYGLTQKGPQKKALLRIEKRIQQGQEAFALFPINSQKNVEKTFLAHNGRPLITPLFLASGDTLSVNSTQITFLLGESNENSI
jgi:hypothetical protein